MVGWIIPLVIVGGCIALSWPLGRYMKWAMEPEHPGPWRMKYEGFWSRLLGRWIEEPQDWKRYCISLVAFNLAMFVIVYTILTIQQWLPLNPEGMGSMEPSLAFNTSSSFTTNTNLQHYYGGKDLSYFSQLFGIVWLQFVSAATGIAALAALCRGLAGRKELGNFYQDLWRATGLVLLPLSLIVGALLVLAGSPMTLEPYAIAQTLEGGAQTIARGPVAAEVAIKMLGTNGGGFFGANGAHPFESPNFWTNILECMAMLLPPMGLVWMFGRMTNRMRHAAVVFGVMLAILLGMIGTAIYFEAEPTRAFTGLSVEDTMNLEGKELRFGSAAAPVFAAVTTAATTGAVDSMHDSLNPITGLVPMVGMWLNMVFGGDGVGTMNMVVYIIITVFIAGLMVGRTPEYLTRKVEAREMTLAVIVLLIHPLIILGGTALFAVVWPETVLNPGSHGLSEIVYEFSSSAANNGSGFEGLGDNTVPWNTATGLVMLLGRFPSIIAILAIAGSLATKKSTPESAGTFRVDTLLFGAVLLATVLIVGALLFLPVAVLGPIAEHLLPGLLQPAAMPPV